MSAQMQVGRCGQGLRDGRCASSRMQAGTWRSAQDLQFCTFGPGSMHLKDDSHTMVVSCGPITQLPCVEARTRHQVGVQHLAPVPVMPACCQLRAEQAAAAAASRVPPGPRRAFLTDVQGQDLWARQPRAACTAWRVAAACRSTRGGCDVLRSVCDGSAGLGLLPAERARAILTASISAQQSPVWAKSVRWFASQWCLRDGVEEWWYAHSSS